MANYLTGINPAVLKWAREAAGFSRSDIATAFKKEEDAVKRWETGELALTYNQLEKLAYQYYKRPLAIFFMPAHPEEEDIKGAFRSLPDQEKNTLSSDTLYAIRLGLTMQMSLRDISNGANLSPKKIFKDINIDRNKSARYWANIVREYLGITINDQIDFKNASEALSVWRDVVEQSGLFIFKRSLKQRDISGFSLIDEVFPIIMLNNSTSKNRQIFSIFHELAHILMSDSGITKDDYINKSYLFGELGKIETFCNRFSNEFLFPAEEFYKWLNIKIDDESIAQLADTYSVSREMVLRKYLDKKIITSEFYLENVERWNKEYYKKDKKKSGGNYYRTQAHYLGRNYLELAFNGYYQGRYTVEQLADYLNVKVSSVSSIERELFRAAS